MMIKKLYYEVFESEEKREKLIALKNALADESNARVLKFELAGDFSKLFSLLNEADDKVRKNAVQIMGVLGMDEYADVIYKAYKNEEKLFVKPAYLTTLLKLECSGLCDEFKERRKELDEAFYDSSATKHIREEISILNKLILKYDKAKQLKFTGYDEEYDIVLTTNRFCVDYLYDEIKAPFAKLKTAVRVKTNDIKSLMNIRIYNELLFALNDLKKIPDGSVEDIAKELLDGDMLLILNKAHKADAYKFRVELRGDVDIAKKLAMECERISKGKLINSISDYDIEIRLVKTKDEDYIAFLKMYTLPDYRFNYRVNYVAASIQPFNAALMMKLCEPYMKLNARVLDPFCGVGTMLIERNKLCKADTLYGVDIFGQAITKARENVAITKIPVHFINRDFFDFTHEYSFDEIVTNMPVLKDLKAENDIYKQFFEKVNELMNEGMIFIYSTNEKAIKANLTPNYRIVETFLMSKKDNTKVFVIKKVN
ncbi:MAG: methyltransferase domain-containing protein [Lachnospira sp.]|nr:methyltransferase domain-containing protein [Lachnospira sp.]